MLNLLVLFLIFNSSYGKELPNKVQDLVKKLFDGYIPEARPNNVNGVIGNVSFGLSPICLNYNSNGEVSGTVWYHMLWFDSRLTWGPEHNVESLSIPNEKVWKPDVVPYFGNEVILPRMNVLIYPNGQVIFIPKVSIKVPCPETNRRMPFEKKTCPLKFGSWTLDGEIMNVDFKDGKKEALIDYYANSKCLVKMLPSKGVRTLKKYSGFPKDYISLDYDLNFLVREESQLSKYKKDIVAPNKYFYHKIYE